VIDISEPTSPQIVGSVDTPGYAHSVVVSGIYAYVADEFVGLQVIDISEPTSPQIVGSVDTPDDAWGIAVSGSHAYVADEFAGLQVIDITEPTSPQIIGSVDTPSWACGVDVSGNYTYVADGESGLQILPTQCEAVGIEGDPEIPYDDENVPSPVARLAVYPNPFNPQTTITFSLHREQHAEVAVYDLTGRLLGVIVDRRYDAGSHSVVWDGKDTAGRAVPSGTYVIRLETESAVEARKVMLLR
jgi:hypothetical protein